jgi:hypothetical protein
MVRLARIIRSVSVTLGIANTLRYGDLSQPYLQSLPQGQTEGRVFPMIDEARTVDSMGGTPWPGQLQLHNAL